MNREEQEHRERLEILEKHIGEYYYMIGDIHSKISDAMEDYHKRKLKLWGIANVVGRSEQLVCEECKEPVVEPYAERYGKKFCLECM